ncbi:MAG TPA: alpha-2-macroglobulin family protein [Opitutaceae bacterium]|nr:alpha-2-macroglobulin family protein [Opitutaceae bacterium]
MKTLFRPAALALACLALFTSAFAANRDAQWKSVDEAAEQGLPKTAIERLEPIIAGALADNAHAEAVRAIGRKIALEGLIEGNKPEEKITRLEAEIAKAPAPMKPVMEALLAHWYWQYFQHNRWRFLQRTQTAAAPGADIQTWDLARILAEIGKHFDAALADPAALQAVPIAQWDALIEKGNVPDAYRPTLFDFLAYEALSFYQAGEQSAVKAEDEFELPAEGPALGDAAAFLAWHATFATKQFPDSPIVKALDLYGRLMEFHRNDADRSAFLDADLARLGYAFNVAVGEEKTERYEAALTRFADGTAKHEISARALYLLANRRHSAGEPVQAREIAQRGYAAFPQSNGGVQCYNLIRQIEAPSATLATEQVWSVPLPTLDVTYKNLGRVYFRAVPVDFADYVKRARWNFGHFEQERLRELLAAKPALAWDAVLPATPDFKQRTEKLPAPTALKAGFYVVFASANPEFSEANNQVSMASIWVSELALVLQQRVDTGRQVGFVLRAGSGEPVAGATVRVWQTDREGRFKATAPLTSDADGRFEVVSKDRQVVLLAEHEGQAVPSLRAFQTYERGDPDRADTHTTFFTDRAIYRPGQTISYKGISIRYDQNAGKYSAIAGLKLTIVFNDPNGQEIARTEQTTNDYGSFSGVFTAPRDRVTGMMSISVLGRSSSTHFNVEEYKRPKFQVTLEAPKEAAKLDGAVIVTGKATAYTGSAIGGAKVKWRVERGVQLPRWCWWWQPPASKAIAHGTAVSADDGTFKVEFTAAPDRSVPAKNEPVFNYSIHTDVTDTTGETRSEDTSVRVGYTALQATFSVPEWLSTEKPAEIAVGTATLDGQPLPAEGVFKVYVLQQPLAVERAPLQPEYRWWWGAGEPQPDPTKPESWALGEVVAEQRFATDASGHTKIAVPLKAGLYRAVVETKDRFGKAVTARETFEVIDPAATRYGVKVPNHFAAPQWFVEPGEKFQAYWGTGYSVGRAFVEVECNGQVLQRYWTKGERTQEVVAQTPTEAMRGGFTVRVTYVRENRAYFNERIVQVPWTNKQLAVKWETFRSKLAPGQKETWTAVITGPDAQRASAEMVAALYDASLDQYAPHSWPSAFTGFRWEYSLCQSEFQNAREGFRHFQGWWQIDQRSFSWSYRAFPSEVVSDVWGWQYERRMMKSMAMPAGRARGMEMDAEMPMPSAPAAAMEMAADKNQPDPAATTVGMGPGDLNTAAAEASPKPDLSKVTARKNLSETAFFFPHLQAGEDGVVRMTFTMPEALTEWKFLGFAHDAQLRGGLLTDKVVTAKDLMVEPNPPRFVREGDAIEFTVKVSNQSDQPQQGTVKLTFADAATQQSVDAALGLGATEQAFDVPAKQSRSYSWRIAVPDGLGFLTYKAVGATAQASDGEEGFLPVLSRRILVTESVPLPIRGKQTKAFRFPKLLESGKSDTLRHQSLTVQMTSQPAWYAVMALPYLMEFPYECSEQVFNRLYANALARHIANSDPKIRRVFEQWRNTPALDSPLTKNQDLKSVLLEETPWVREAKNESEARRNVGLLFDANRLDEETASTLRKLADQQLGSGLWPWFPGGRENEYISLYIVTGFGRLRHLGVAIDAAPAVKALGALDVWIAQRYREIQRLPHPEEYVPNHTDVIYLYGRSFFLEDQPVADTHRQAVDFFLGQLRKLWLKTDCRMCQAQGALALQRFGDKATPRAILASLKERSVSNEELGMFWRDTELSWWWYRAPIETQATMVEAFAEVAQDAQAVDDLQVWLLKQKQTQDWKTTKATADAIYALLLGGRNLLGSDALVEVALGGTAIKPEKVEAGTGFYEQKFAAPEIKPAMGEITVKKVDDGVSWGSVHWQYLEDMAKVTPHEGTPLKLRKSLWVKQTTVKGQELVPVAGPIAVGDELVVRIELRTDRDMEYVHLKDQRGSGTEPVAVLSQYKYQDGLAYYESTRDTASHFFIDYLPKGTYVFEYSTRVQLKGAYQTGIAEIQCMYAPEFNSHSESFVLEVK